jgi:hypothetical protein
VTERAILTPPRGARSVLLHVCCAPCSCEIMEALSASGVAYTVFFYNPNIHPRDEYLLRKEENIRFARKLQAPFVDADYDAEAWLARTLGMEREPERGARCAVCFDVRLERAARHAHGNGFAVMTTSLGISRWKNKAQVDACGHRAASAYEGLSYWDFNWRKNGGSERMVEIGKRESFYRQDYCGCVYSLRDTKMRRMRQGGGTAE